MNILQNFFHHLNIERKRKKSERRFQNWILAKMGKLSILALIALCSISLAKADWELVWEDQFDGEDLNRNYRFDQGCNGWGNNELQCYTVNRPENVRQENGMLIITARREWWDDGQTTLPFTSTRMLTYSNFLYGKFEIRARLPKGKHLWPAFWMMPTYSEYGQWPRSGEIDIMEYRGQRPTNTLGTIHYGESKENKGQAGSPETTFPYDFSQDFHVFGLDWSPTKIMWIVDDRVYHEETLERNFWESVYNANGQPFDKEFHIIINLAVGGMFFGDEPFDPIEADGWEKPTFEIDWLRKWTWRM